MNRGEERKGGEIRVERTVKERREGGENRRKGEERRGETID